jgi:hypothetical protein
VDRGVQLATILNAYFAGNAPVCPYCHTNSWHVSGPVMMPFVALPEVMPTTNQARAAQMLLGKGMPVVEKDGVAAAALICMNCFHMNLYALKPIFERLRAENSSGT